MSGSVQKNYTAIAATTWMGPLPPPEVLAKFQSVVPNAADRILTMAEEEARNRHACQRAELDEAARQNARDHLRVTVGQVVAAVILILVVVSSTVCSIRGDWKTACALAGMGCANIAAVFIGREHGKKD